MRLGLLPSQQRALDQAFKKARALDRFRETTRRRFWAVGLLGVVGTATGFWAGRSTASETSAADPPKVDWTQSLATAPMQTLRAQAVHVIAALEKADGDDRLWQAYHRLVAYAMANPNDETLIRQVLRIAGRSPAPEHTRDAAALLKRLLGR